MQGFSPPTSMMPAPPPGAVPIPQAQYAQPTGHSPYFNQYYAPYPGESVVERLGKHLMLKLGQVFFLELSNFFGLWRWPKAGK